MARPHQRRRRYPRRSVRVDITHVRSHVLAVMARADHDEIIVLHCGKPYRVIIGYAYFSHLSSWAELGAQRKGHAKVQPRHRWRHVNQRYADLHGRAGKLRQENSLAG